MSFKFANAFKSSETPRDFYEELNKNIYEQSFENAPNYYSVDCSTPIEYEYPYGSNKWNRVEGRVDNIVLANTGTKSGNDYKNFIFKPSFPLNILYGMKFRWKDNIWLVQNTDGMTSNTSKSCVVRRCNNVLRFYNKDGKKIYEPCCIDDVVRFTNTNRMQEIVTSRGEYVILVQRNSNTLQLKPNDRFLFGTPEQRECLRIYGTGIRNFINSYTDNEDSPSLTQIYLEHYQYDTQLDDLEEGFCNAYKNQFKIEIENNSTIYQVGSQRIMKAIAYKNGNVIDKLIKWKSSDESIATITEDGSFTAKSCGNVTITAYLDSNNDIYNTLDLQIQDTTIPENSVVEISPNITYLLSGKGQNEQEFEVYLYKNGIKQTDTFIIQDTSTDVPINNYRITIIDGNHFKVENLGMYMNKPINITCTSGNISKSIDIELRGLF